jgi:serine/threonine protein phosphatase PrpC
MPEEPVSAEQPETTLPEAADTPVPDEEAPLLSSIAPDGTRPAESGDAPVRYINLDADDTVPAPPPVQTRELNNMDTAQLSGQTQPLAGTMPLMDGVTRPLQSDSPLLQQPPTSHGTFAQATDVGVERGNNEDAAFTFYATGRTSEDIPDLGLFIVADGMGGHQDGEKASALSVRVVVNQMLKTLYLPLLADNPNTDPIVEVLADAVQRANAEIVSRVPDGGTTITAVVVMHDRAYIAHVGDSRAYLVQRNSIEQLTRDHSLVQRLIELDHMTPDEARNYPNPNMLYRALGHSDVIDIDTLTRRIPTGARLLLCSDGLWGQVEEQAILDTVMRAATPQDACNQLIAMANAAGGVDNVTVIIFQMPR